MSATCRHCTWTATHAVYPVAIGDDSSQEGDPLWEATAIGIPVCELHLANEIMTIAGDAFVETLTPAEAPQ